LSRILAAWEMGANMGHIDRMLTSARALRARGHEVRFVLRDLSRAYGRVASEGFAIGQAPLWLPRMAHPPRLGNYAVVLAAAGWMDASGLAGLLCGWQQTFDLVRADVLICDHAPTAMLASRGSGMQVWAIGNSFENPPPGPYFPSMLAGHAKDAKDAADAARCAQYDATLLAPTNQALALLGRPPLARLTDLFGHTRTALASLPELGHYSGYPQGTEWAGPCYVGDAGTAAVWPAGSGPRAFVYLTPGHPGFRPVIEALRSLGMVALVHAKGLTAEAAARLAGSSPIRFEPAPVQVDPAVAQADIVISHASLGTATAALLAGKPQLVLPSHTEQGMVARRIEQAGIGLALPVRADGAAPAGVPPPALQPLPLLRRLVDEPGFKKAALALAQRHAGASPQRTGQRLADLIEARLRA
jgi:hypothetical protein